MRTEDLIDTLAREPAAPTLTDRTILIAFVLAILVPVVLFLGMAGLRPDAPLAYLRPLVAAKTALAVLLFGLLLPQVPRLARPEGWGELRLRRLALPLGIGLLLWGSAYALRAPAERFAEVNPASVAECLGSITLISIVPVAVILRLLRRGAVADPARAGAVAGLAAAAGAATGYSFFCTQDNPLFYVLWYGLAILVVSAASALIGRRVLAW